ncbi:probable DNA primase large subunit isoform X2 [Cimex lectularius]|uniref:FHA domain-containing protein n=1 Tax=Cimex lectularius TaxID=79782 RepID=A0A8I6RKR7_CIMLE|nr:probable DNA primase large subunit isoform X2 [Cimex lectularius]
MARAILCCVKPEDNEEKRILDLNPGDKVRLGRAHKNELPRVENGLFILRRPFISYNHAFIFHIDNEFYLEDLSTNGTYINGKQIDKGQRTPITTGDIVQLGKDKIDQHDNLPVVLFYIQLFLPGPENEEYLLKLENEYPSVINTYSNYPTFPLNLQYLYDATLKRFELLQHLNKFGEVEFNGLSSVKHMVDELSQHDLHTFCDLVTRKSMSCKDYYLAKICDEASHFILRIACCRNYPLRKWFIKQETKLLFIKWFYLNDFERKRLLYSEGLHYPKADDLEKKVLAKKSEGFLDVDKSYFKVPFSEASNLLRTKTAIIENGIIFVKTDQMVLTIMVKLDTTMDITMKHVKKRLHNIWDDKRIVSIINYVEKNIHFDRYSFSQRDANILPGHIQKLSAESFPLCMKLLQDQLAKDHHLRNGGRFQYSLFLKAIGLSLPNAMDFWRYHFTKKIPVSKFMKEYSYHIKHVYGVVGKMADYPPQNCAEIMKAVPGPLDYHGCPFNIFDKNRMRNILKRIDIKKTDINNILEVMEKGMPQMTCSKYFDTMHGTMSVKAIRHPNLYYEASRKIRIEYEKSSRNQFGLSNLSTLEKCGCASKSDAW